MIKLAIVTDAARREEAWGLSEAASGVWPVTGTQTGTWTGTGVRGERQRVRGVSGLCPEGIGETPKGPEHLVRFR